MAVRERLSVGRIQRAHGTAGWLRMESLSGETAHLTGLAEIYLEARTAPVAVEHSRPVPGGVLLKLEGVDTREEAQRLHGNVVWVPRENASPLGPGEYYVGDLHGCAVYQGERCLGTVSGFMEGGATALIEVRGAGGGSFLLPFVDACVDTVSVERGAMQIREDYEVPSPEPAAGVVRGRGHSRPGRRRPTAGQAT